MQQVKSSACLATTRLAAARGGVHRLRLGVHRLRRIRLQTPSTMPRSSLPFLLALIAAVRADAYDVAADTFNFLAIGDCEPTTHDLL